MKAVILGAGGIVGQHMMLQVPLHMEPVFCRRADSVSFAGVDLTNTGATLEFLATERPDVIVNLAGENRVDVVEATPNAYEEINTYVPEILATWCDSNKSHLVQVSTQGVFSGNNPPYSATSTPDPITEYGKQKAEAESLVQRHKNWTIARLTFVLGLRPFGLGRQNPVEAMLITEEQLQVNDRWFSPCFADDAAYQLWMLAGQKPKQSIKHIGIPITTSRYQVATTLMHSFEGMGYKIMGVSHNHFPGIAPRPKDTTWASDALYNSAMSDGLRRIVRSWSDNYRKKS